MKSNLLSVLFLLGLAPVCMGQASSASVSHSNLVTAPSEIRKSGRPASLHALTLRVNDSFQAVAQLRDPMGFVHDRAALKEHTANLKALRKALKGTSISSEVSGNDEVLLILRLLHDTTESFIAFEQANDQPDNPNIYVTMDVRESFSAHTKYLSQLTAAVAHTQQHQPKATAPATE